MEYKGTGIRWWRPYDFPPEGFRQFSPAHRRIIAQSAKNHRTLLEAMHAPDGRDPHPFVIDPTGNRAKKAMTKIYGNKKFPMVYRAQ